MSASESDHSSSEEDPQLSTREKRRKTLTPLEKVLSGLTSHKTNPKLRVIESPGKGRGVVSDERLEKGDFVVEYRSAEVYPRSEKTKHVLEYELNGEGSYILEVQTNNGWSCLDATRALGTVGRLINHSTQPNLKPFRPLFVRGKWRVGFIALRAIEPEEELTWDYKCQPEGQKWLYRHPPAVEVATEHTQQNNTGEGTVGSTAATGPVDMPLDFTSDPGSKDPADRSQVVNPESGSKDPADRSQVVNADSGSKDPADRSQDVGCASPPVVNVDSGSKDPADRSQDVGCASPPVVNPDEVPADHTQDMGSASPSVPPTAIVICSSGSEADYSQVIHTSTTEVPAPSDESRQYGTCRICYRADIPLTVLPNHIRECANELLEEVGLVAVASTPATSFLKDLPSEMGLLRVEDEDPGQPLHSDKGKLIRAPNSEVPLDTDIPFQHKEAATREKNGSPEEQRHPFRSSHSKVSPQSVPTLEIEKDDNQPGTSWGEHRESLPYRGPGLHDSSDSEGDFPTVLNRRKRQPHVLESGSSSEEVPSKRRHDCVNVSSSSSKESDDSITSDEQVDPRSFVLAEAQEVSHESSRKRKKRLGRRELVHPDTKIGKQSRKREGRKDYHLRKWCPVAGCKATSQLRLPVHLARYHSHIPYAERCRMAKTAKVDKRKKSPPPRPKDTPSIVSLLTRAAKEGTKKPARCEETVEQTDTRSFARFPLDHPDVRPFLAFLQGLDGRKKSTREANQIATDVSKFLKFADPRSNRPNWNRVVDPTKIREYLDMLEHTGACGVSGQLTKLDRLIHAIRYVSLEIAGEEDATMSLRCSRTIARLQQWKAALRPAKKLQAAMNQGDGGTSQTLREMTSLFDNKDIWLDVTAALTKGEEASREEIKTVVAAVMARLAYRSWQRQGAVTNATLDEFQHTHRIDDEGSESVYVMQVSRHKTAREGPANITMSTEERRLVRKYVTEIRPACDPYYRSDNLFVDADGKPISSLASLTRWLGSKYDITLPSCTEVRKVGATRASLDLSPKDAKLLQEQMSHSEPVHKKYYALTRGAAQAAKAHVLRDTLRRQMPPTSDEETPESESGRDSDESAEESERRPAKASKARKQSDVLQPSVETSEGSEEETQQAPPAKKKKEKQVRSRVPYSEKHLALIKAFFRKSITRGKKVTNEMCREFLRLHPMPRTPKKIQDKVRQLIENKN